ncbi:cupin domain-containing protein [Streptomyces sp. NPDC007983]|uniref:cupin domain-containing protein n=1 Tax=Streptomyces sp. NPDC007983 TaxID=3364800 RepID=UPI0036E546F6
MDEGEIPVNVSPGEVYENPRCGERIVVRTPASESGGKRSVMDLYVEPGGFAAGEHIHPISHERFTLVRGKLAVIQGGRKTVLDKVGQSILIQPGIEHRWWNPTGDKTYAICEVIGNGTRFEQMVMRQLFCLAQDGKTNAEGMPKLLQRAVTSLEFQDVLRFVKPSWKRQRILYEILAPVARRLGYMGCNPEYMNRKPSEVAILEDLPEEVLAWHY